MTSHKERARRTSPQSLDPTKRLLTNRDTNILLTEINFLPALVGTEMEDVATTITPPLDLLKQQGFQENISNYFGQLIFQAIMRDPKSKELQLFETADEFAQRLSKAKARVTQEYNPEYDHTDESQEIARIMKESVETVFDRIRQHFEGVARGTVQPVLTQIGRARH